jgi:uncharacterized protein YjbI with pentapeptide repeats
VCGRVHPLFFARSHKDCEGGHKFVYVSPFDKALFVFTGHFFFPPRTPKHCALLHTFGSVLFLCLKKQISSSLIAFRSIFSCKTSQHRNHKYYDRTFQYQEWPPCTHRNVRLDDEFVSASDLYGRVYANLRHAMSADDVESFASAAVSCTDQERCCERRPDAPSHFRLTQQFLRASRLTHLELSSANISASFKRANLNKSCLDGVTFHRCTFHLTALQRATTVDALLARIQEGISL